MNTNDTNANNAPLTNVEKFTRGLYEPAIQAELNRRNPVVVEALLATGKSPQFVIDNVKIDQTRKAPKTEAELIAGIKFRVSKKGALSVYGVGRFPVTLYREQWERILARVEGGNGMKAFIASNATAFAKKGDPRRDDDDATDSE